MKKKTLFVKKGTKEYYKAKLKEFEVRILELEKKLKKEKLKKVRCETCKKLIGLKRGENYDLENGVIQKGQGRKKPLLSYCSRRCEIKSKQGKNK